MFPFFLGGGDGLRYSGRFDAWAFWATVRYVGELPKKKTREGVRFLLTFSLTYPVVKDLNGVISFWYIKCDTKKLEMFEDDRQRKVRNMKGD